MADNTTQIKTRFSLEGMSKALAELKGFVNGVRAAAAEAQKSTAGAKGGFEGVGKAAAKAGAEASESIKILGKEIKLTSDDAKGLGTAFTVAQKTITGSLEIVMAAMRGIRSAAASVFAPLIAGARAAAGAVKFAFDSVHEEAQTTLVKLLKAQFGTVTGGGIALKLSLPDGASQGLLNGIKSLAQRAAGLFSSIFHGALKLVNPFSRTLTRTVRQARRSALLVGAPTLAAGAAVNSGANDVQSEVDENADLASQGGFDIQRQTAYKSYFEQLGGAAGDATNIMRKFVEASKDIAEKGADSPFAQSLEAAGVAFQELDGSARSGVAIFSDLVDLYQKGTLDPNKYQDVANAMHQIAGDGKDALTFFRFLDQTTGDGGAQRLAELDAAAAKFGTVIGPDQIAGMRAYESGLGDLKQAFAGLKISFVTNIGPTLGAFFSGLADMLARNKDAITLFARGMIENTALLTTEILILATQSKEQFANYDFKFPWLVTIRDAITWTFGVLKAFFGFVAAAAPLTIAVFDKVGGSVAPLATTIGEKLGWAAIWVRNFVASLAELYAYGQVEPGFGWLQKVAFGFHVAGEAAEWLWHKIIEVQKALKERAEEGLGGAIKDAMKDALDYAIKLGNAIYSFAKTGDAGEGFLWIDTVVDGFKLAYDYVTATQEAVAGFIKTLAGNEEAAKDNPVAAKLREQVLAWFPVLKTFAESVGSFLQGLLPPLLGFAGAAMDKLQKYLKDFTGYLDKSKGYVIGVVETVAQYFDGFDEKKVEKKFQWVYDVLNAVKEIAHTIAGIARAAYGQAFDPGGYKNRKPGESDQDYLARQQDEKQFDWVRRVVQSFQLMRSAILGVGDALSALTGHLLGPVQAALYAFFGLKIAGMIAGLLKNIGALKVALAALGISTVGGVARAGAGALPALGAVGSFALSALTGSGLLESTLTAIVGGIAAAAKSSGFRAAVAAKFPTAAEAAAKVAAEGEAAAAAASAAKVAREAKAGQALDAAQSLLINGAAAGAGGKAAVHAGAAVEGAVVGEKAASVAAKAGGVAEAATGAAVVEAEVAGSGFAAGLVGAAGLLSRFAGVVGLIITSIEAANFIADITGVKQKIKDALSGPPEDNSRDARYHRAMLGGSFAESIGDSKAEKFDTDTQAPIGSFNGGPGGAPLNLNPDSDLVAAKDANGELQWVLRRNADGSSKSAYQLQGEANYNGGLVAKPGLTQPQQNTLAATNDPFIKQFGPVADASDFIKAVNGPDSDYNSASVRKQLTDGANVAPAVLSKAVSDGVKDGLAQVGRPLVVGAPDNSRQNQQSSVAQPDVVPGLAFAGAN